LATSLDMSRSSLYRALEALEDAGCLARSDKEWRLPDEEQLRLLVE